MAESRHLRITMPASRSTNWRISSACCTSLLRMRSSTSRALYADMRTYRTSARVPGRSLVLTPNAGMSLSPSSHGLLLAGVVAERAGRRELAELVTDHRLGDVYGDVLAPVVHRDRVPDHVGNDRGATAPRLDDLLLALGVQLVDLLEQVVVDERALLQAARHDYLLEPRVRRRRTISFWDSL